MDTNYILRREQQSISRALSSTSRSARAVHRAFAAAYRKMLANDAAGDGPPTDQARATSSR